MHTLPPSLRADVVRSLCISRGFWQRVLRTSRIVQSVSYLRCGSSRRRIDRAGVKKSSGRAAQSREADLCRAGAVGRSVRSSGRGAIPKSCARRLDHGTSAAGLNCFMHCRLSEIMRILLAGVNPIGMSPDRWLPLCSRPSRKTGIGECTAPRRVTVGVLHDLSVRASARSRDASWLGSARLGGPRRRISGSAERAFHSALTPRQATRQLPLALGIAVARSGFAISHNAYTHTRYRSITALLWIFDLRSGAVAN